VIPAQGVRTTKDSSPFKSMPSSVGRSCWASHRTVCLHTPCVLLPLCTESSNRQFTQRNTDCLPAVPRPMCGSGSSVGIVTDYGLDGPGSNPGGDELFRTSPGPAVGPAQPPVKWVPVLSRR